MDPSDYETDPADDIDLDAAGLHTVTGEPITEESAAAAADKAERGVRGAGLIPGGKSLSGAGKHSPIVQTRVPERTHAQLQQIAAGRGVGVSKVLRQAIDELIERENA